MIIFRSQSRCHVDRRPKLLLKEAYFESGSDRPRLEMPEILTTSFKMRVFLLLILCASIPQIFGVQDASSQYRRQGYGYYAPQPQRPSPPKREKKRIGPKGHMRLGKVNMKKSRYTRAIRHFSALLKADGSLKEAYLLRGRCFDQIGRPNMAVKDYTKYISANPKDHRGYELRADAYNFNLDFQRAIQDYNRALALAPDSVDPLIGRGLAHMGLENYKAAIGDYRKALKRRGATPEVVSNLGLAYMRNNEPNNAIKCFERALELEKGPRWKDKLSKWLEDLYQDPRVARKDPTGKGSIPRHHPSKSLW